MSADAKLKAYIDRVLRLKEEQDTLGDDIREVYAEAKAEGYDKTVMGKLVAHLRKVQRAGEGAVSEQEMVFDTYLQAYHSASGTVVATHTHEEDFDPTTGEVFGGEANAKLITTVATGMRTEIGRKALVTALDIMIKREEAEERRSDLGLNIQTKHEDIRTAPETAEGETGMVLGTGKERPLSIGLHTDGDPEARFETDSLHQDQQMDRAMEGSFETGSEAAEKGREAIPAGPEGVDLNHAGAGESPATDIVMEYVPKSGVKRLPFAHCFPDHSKADYERLEKDIAANRVKTPIIRQGDVIVDGFARYMISRLLGMSYPVQEYTGTDILLDVIEWQRASRNFTQAQERKIAADLAKEVPHRADDIFAAFGLAEALEAAE